MYNRATVTIDRQIILSNDLHIAYSSSHHCESPEWSQTSLVWWLAVTSAPEIPPLSEPLLAAGNYIKLAETSIIITTHHMSNSFVHLCDKVAKVIK